MDEYISIEGNSFLKKNTTTGVVINTNEQELQAARQRRKDRMQKAELEASKEKEIEEMKSDINQIKSLLQQLLEKQQWHLNQIVLYSKRQIRFRN